MHSGWEERAEEGFMNILTRLISIRENVLHHESIGTL